MPVPASQYSVNYFPINNGGYEMWSSYDGQQYQADMKVAKSLGFNTLRVILAAKNGYFDFSALTAAELVQLTDFYSRAKSTGIALHLTLFALLRQVAGLVADLPEILRPGPARTSPPPPARTPG
jgi:endo-1,4-beta-mannosidase